VSLLAHHFLDERAESAGLAPLRLGEEALQVLEDHKWPGNVRELRTVLHQAASGCGGATILPTHLNITRRTVSSAQGTPNVAGQIPIPSLGRSLSSVEDELVRITLQLTNWNQSATARILEISRPTLARKIEVYGITQDDTATRVRRP
jgi:DNA-binding NtrC family response regulator